MREQSFESGGRVPDPVAVLGDVCRDLVGRAEAHALASLIGHSLALTVSFVVYVAFVLAMYAGLMIWAVGSLGTLAAGMQVLLLAAGAAVPADVLVLVGLAGYVGWWGATMVVMLAALCCVYPTFYVALAPLHAGWTRAVAKPGGVLDPADVARLAFRDLPSTLACAAFVALLTCALLVTGPGAVLPLLLFGFAPSLVAIHRLSWWSALKTSARHVAANPLFHVAYLCAWLLLWTVAAMIPLAGPAFMVALHVRVYRVVFGDGPVPVERRASAVVGRPALV